MIRFFQNKAQLIRQRVGVLILIGLLSFSSCTNYYMTVSSLKEQFAGIDSSKLVEVYVEGPFSVGVTGALTNYHYKANPIKVIKCTDKDGNPAQLINGPRIETRITYGYKHKRTIFYFDRVMLINNSIVGVESRIISSIRKVIPLDSIVKIEVQDDHKRFSYVAK